MRPGDGRPEDSRRLTPVGVAMNAGGSRTNWNRRSGALVRTRVHAQIDPSVSGGVLFTIESVEQPGSRHGRHR